MMKAFYEVGLIKSIRFFFSTLFLFLFNFSLFPSVRRIALKMVGAKIGADTVIHEVRFFNAYRTGFQGLSIGKSCFLGTDCLIDLADKVILEDDVTLAERVTILTHINVGYKDHPLQQFFPSSQSEVRIKRGAFIGANATIVSGISIGECAFVAAGSMVIHDVAPWTLVAGAPARMVRSIK